MPLKRYTLSDLIDVMERLRDKNSGCPWDIEQNFKTIAPHTIEEAYEVADAIARNDMTDLREELGDLLLQPIYHAQMAAEEDVFDIHDVIHDITHKMIERHPHVFSNATADTPEDVNKIWDDRKNQEKPKESAIDGVAHGLPALLRAQKLQKQAAKTGFEWTDLNDVLDKIEEEVQEMREALQKGTPENQEEELGDILFVLANYARMLGINAETALRNGNYKFEQRFKGMEADFKKQNQTIAQNTPQERKAMWDKQKKKA